MTVTDNGPAGEPVRRISNERVRFYLDNYKMIETWAQIRAEANQELNDLFLSMVDSLSLDAVGRGYDDIVVRADEQTNPRKPRILITRRAWHNAHGDAPAATAIEWDRPPIGKDGDLIFYVGIRVGDRSQRDKRTVKHLSALAPTLRNQLGAPWEKEHGSFPVWRWIAPAGESLGEAGLADEAQRAAWKCWQVCAPHIDEALGLAGA